MPVFPRFLAAAAVAIVATISGAVAEDAVKPVKLMTVAADDDTLSRVFFGKVVARQSVDMAFQVGGQIVEFPVIEGQLVSEGDLLAQLDQEQFSLALEQAAVQKDLAERTLDRLTKLRGNTVSQVALDDATTQLSLADIAFRQAERNLNNATLYAPFDALVAARDVDNYVTISAGTPVVRLHDMSEIRIEIDVPEILFQTASKEKNVQFVAEFPAHDTPFPVAIREFNAEAAEAGQTYRLTLGMAPREDLNVLPGSSVNVRVSAAHENPGILIPSTAIVAAPDGALSVMRFVAGDGDAGTVSATPVTVKPAPNGDFELLSGLSAGDVIVAAGASALRDGDAVRRFTGFAN
ncbi:RND family efflux transporter, MFP subunit [Aliiroseovarius sediminilitoris]|uniref:RND family efflux transporter, MFP subunit n=1 Tax=Aliiroseovarius sediminilitoris TaxID=1173584 RepID=A0A1I0MUI1_9RHOB|nr:efflux RND transporter periplasmic adaptor subunit [Aliiroseovarius sediminilitoris]SEV92449.1 RND family efflux transporter, MFP subunit [Aliiroseovarius sediminilitoris]